MTRRIHRWAALVAASLLLAISARALADAAQTQDALRDRLLSDCFDYVYAQEMIYGDVLWAIGYFEEYDRTRTWEALQKARAAASAAREDIALRKLPPSQMTADDYHALLLEGVDASYVEYAQDDFEASRTTMQNGALLMMTHLAHAVFEGNGWETSVSNAAQTRAIAQAWQQYCAWSVDWLLLELDDEERARSFGEQLELHCPTIVSMRMGDGATQDDLEAAVGQLLDGVEEALRTQSAETEGQVRADFELFADALESGDVTKGIGEIIDIDGLPLILPYPTWYGNLSDQRFYYSWTRADGTSRYARAREDIDSAPDGCAIVTPGVLREALEAYAALLASRGVECLSRKEEDGVLTLLYSCAGSQFAFMLDGDTLTTYMLEAPVLYAPTWYIAAR